MQLLHVSILFYAVIANKATKKSNFCIITYNLFMNRLKELRIKNKLTQKEIADVIGLTQSSYSRYERGELELGEQLIKLFSNFFRVSADYLINNERYFDLNLEDIIKLKESAKLLNEVVDKLKK